MENIIKLERSTIPLVSSVVRDEFIEASEIAFDCRFDGESKFYPWKLPTNLPKKFNLGVIVGSSGSGKTNLLKEFGTEEIPEWDPDKSIISHFENANEGINKLTAVGLNSIPSWYKSYNVLSNGEKFRADLARKLKSNSVIDEYTSVVDRNVAKAASVSISKYIKKNKLENVVLSTCHRDILDWLEPDWVMDLDAGELVPDFFFRRPKITLKIYRTSYDNWGMFKDHHYLTGNLNKSARCYICVWDEIIVGFASVITMPSGTVKNAWRGHRSVVLPDFQGMGIGVRFTEQVAQIHVDEGHRFFTRTAHPKMIDYKENSPLWRATSKNKIKRKDVSDSNTYRNHVYDNIRLCGSFEYIGDIYNKKIE